MLERGRILHHRNFDLTFTDSTATILNRHIIVANVIKLANQNVL